MADNTKKKNVKDNKFKLSYVKPTRNTIAYKVIHRSSAVSNKCKAVLVLIKILINKIKKKKISRFKSPNNIKKKRRTKVYLF
jgi:hypothetical protein